MKFFHCLNSALILLSLCFCTHFYERQFENRLSSTLALKVFVIPLLQCSLSCRDFRYNVHVLTGAGFYTKHFGSSLDGWRAESNNIVYLDFMKRRMDLRPGGPRCTCLHVTQSNPLGTMASVENSHCCCRWVGMDR